VPTRSPAGSRAKHCRPRFKQELVYIEQIRGASICPAVQNIILACRAFGLGTLITTDHVRCEGEVKALLGIPDDVSTCALMPIGYPENKFGPVQRRAVNEVAYGDRWGTPWRG
jgi:nitroreductase